MPKKTRKMKQRAAMRRAVQPVDVQPVEDVETDVQVMDKAPVRMRPTFGAPRAVSPLQFDYTHIYGDLKRIALFAGFFFVMLIVLSFVIK